MPFPPGVRETLARRMAGEIILSTNPGATMKKWRQLFGVSQMRLSDEMLLSSSAVISDYESGRRKSPGTRFVRRFVKALLKIDQDRGGQLTEQFVNLVRLPSAAVLDVREFPLPISLDRFCRATKAEVTADPAGSSVQIRGYLVIDTQRAMESLSGLEFFQIFGAAAEKALVFTNIEHPLFPALALRLSPLKPLVAVFHGTPPNELVVKLAEFNKTPILHCETADMAHLIKALRRLYRVTLRAKVSRLIKAPPKAGA
jgi:putative transcriptional regulator